jgi:hypothetical protein
MKKIIIAFFMLLGLSATSVAQIEGGTILAGGNAYFNHYRSFETSAKSSQLMFAPQVGFAFADNFVAGAYFSFSSFSSFSSWTVAPFLRYYAKNAFVQLGYGYSQSKTGNQISSGSVLSLDLGYAIFLNDNVALEPALYYNQNLKGFDSASMGMKLGFQIYFNR